MMGLALRTFPDAGIVALFEEASSGGDPTDIGAPCNRPAADPAAWLANIYFHSGLDNLEVLSDSTTTISHAAVGSVAVGGISDGGGDAGSGGSAGTKAFRLGVNAADHLLVTHGLGYIPRFLVVLADNTLFGGLPGQTQSDGRGRYLSAYATTSAIRLREFASATNVNLAATNLTYRIIVLREQRAASGDKLVEFEASSGIFRLGLDRFAVDRRYEQIVPGGSPFSLAYGKQLDLKNGAPRFVRPDGTVFDPVPTDLYAYLSAQYGAYLYTGATGPAQGYNGSFAGATRLLVQAP